eukprot:1005695-Amphidinium_carterae.1
MVSAMHSRVVFHKLEPYGDFSLLTPFGRRMQKVLRHRSWMPQEDGSFKPIDAPGPSDFTTWAACFKVYAAVLYMLRLEGSDGRPQPVVKPSSVERYFESFRQLAEQNPEVWHLAVEAEDHADLNTQLTPRGTQSSLDKEVRRPSLAFIARGGPKVPPSLEYKLEAGFRSAVNTSNSNNNRGQKRKAVSSTSASGQGPKKDQRGRYLTTAEGLALCFTYHGRGRTEPCPAGGAHACQFCLGAHRNSMCPSRNTEGGKGKRSKETAASGSKVQQSDSFQ